MRMIDRIIAAISPTALFFAAALAGITDEGAWFFVAMIQAWNCAVANPIFVSKNNGKTP